MIKLESRNVVDSLSQEALMTLVRIKEKFQVTLPADLRAKIALEVGDYLDVDVKEGAITLTPKAIVDREIAAGLEDVNQGRVLGPFSSAAAAKKALRHKGK